MMTEFTRRAIIVIPAEKRDYANALALDYDPVGGDQTFVVGLSSESGGPVTHYWCNTAMRQPVWDAVSDAIQTDPELVDVRMFDGHEMTPDEVLSVVGLHRLAVEEMLQ